MEEFEKVQKVLVAYEKEILALPGVVGVSTGIISPQTRLFCIKVNANMPVPRGGLKDRCLPFQLEGVEVILVISGDIRAFRREVI